MDIYEVKQKKNELTTDLNFVDFVDIMQKHDRVVAIWGFAEDLFRKNIQYRTQEVLIIFEDRIDLNDKDGKGINYLVETSLDLTDLKNFIEELMSNDDSLNPYLNAVKVFDLLYDLKLISFIKEVPFKVEHHSCENIIYISD